MMNSPSDALGRASKWKEISSSSQDYSQGSTDPTIPTFSTGGARTFMAGSDVKPEGYGYSYASPEYLAADPSFSVYPDIDSPEVDRWMEGLRGQPGYQPAKLDMNKFNQRLIDLRNEVHRTLKGA
jgi:hypothetical protein